MTHLPYIVASFGLGVLVPLGFGVAALLRMRGAARRLAAVDPRQRIAQRSTAGRQTQ